MRILHVVPSLSADQGGIRTAVAGAMRAMAGAGMTAEAACVGEPEPPVPGLIIHSFAPSAPRATRASQSLKRWLAENAREFDALVAHTIWLSPTRYAVDAARAAGVPVWLAPHGMLDPDALAHHAWRKRLRWLGGESRRVKACTLVFSTQADADRARTTPAVRDLPFVVIPNPVDPGWQPAERKAGGAARILCLNRVHPRKGVLELARALALLHSRGLDFRAEFAGGVQDARYAARARRECAAAEAAGKVRWLGAVDAAKAQELTGQADILVHPATGFENFGMVIAEAAGAGVCILASPRALLVPEMVRAGALMECEPEPGAMADALARLLQDAALRQSLGRNARQYARHFEPKPVAQAWAQAFAKGRVSVAKV